MQSISVRLPVAVSVNLFFDDSHAHIDGDKIFQRFAHLKPFDMEVASMQKIVDPCVASMESLRKSSARAGLYQDQPQIVQFHYHGEEKRDQSHPNEYPSDYRGLHWP